MKQLLTTGLALAALAFVGTSSADAGPRGYGYGNGYAPNYNGNGYGASNFAPNYGRNFDNGYGNRYGLNQCYRNCGPGYGLGGYQNQGHYVPHTTTHFDYHPPSLQPHGNHFDYVPGHYDPHTTTHFDYHPPH